jgi:hypothetical protein
MRLPWFIHLLFLLLQVMSCPQSFTCSQQFLSHAGKLLHAHMRGVPSSLAIRRLGIGHHLQLFDGGTQLLLLHSTFVRIPAGAGYWSRSSASARSHRSLVLHRPDSRFHTVHMQCERAWQKMSHAFFTPFGKRCCEHLEAGGHAAVQIITSLFYHWQCVIGNKF